jgi:hypothetical protein
MTPSPSVPATRPRVVMVSTRQLDGEPMAGRLRVAHAIRACLDAATDLQVLRLPSALTDLTLRRLLECGLSWLFSVLRGRPLPLQCALFASWTDHRHLLDQVPEDAVSLYADGVRTYSLVRYLRKHRPQLRIIVDLDDLMSRRMSLLLQASQPLSPGYLTKRLPPFLLRIAMSSRFGHMIVRHEQATLARVERDLARIADALVLLSAEDARIMTDQCDAQCRAQVEVIPPPSEPIAPIAPLAPPVRFVFIGSDALTQNRLTIDYLIDLWRRAKLTAPLVFYGLWGREIALPPEITAAGYVEDLKDVYDGHSVLLTPSLIGGGVKTKVLEAFAYGASVIGNAITFESMSIGDYPLQIDDEEDLVRLIQAPAEQMPRFAAAARAGVNYVAQFHDPQMFGRRWLKLMAPEARSPAASPAAAVPLETH